MKPLFRVATSLALLAAAAGGARAQGEDATVLPRGMVELGALGSYTRWDTRFGPGGTQPLGAFASGAAYPASLFPAAESTTRRALDSIFGTLRRKNAAGYTLTDADLYLGTLRTDLSADVREVPVSIRVGLLRRLTLAVTVPIERRATSVNGLRLTDARLGFNTRADTLARLLSRIDPALAGTAASPFLPLAGSPAGIALQEQYRSVTGDTTTLPLPTRAINDTELNGQFTQAGDTLAFRSGASGYGLGDVELSARLQLLNTTPAVMRPLRGARGLRAAAEVGFRLPTGGGALADSTLELVTESGHAGPTAALFGDAFLGRFWVSAYGRYAMRLGREVPRRFFDPARPDTVFTDSVRVERSAGDRLELGLTPRYRLTDEISFAGRYAFFREGAVSYGDVTPPRPGLVFASLESTRARAAHLLGLGMSYSTYPAWEAGRSGIPYEASLMYERALAGSGDAPRLSRITAGLRFFFPAWGRPPRPDTTQAAPADTAAPPTVRPREPEPRPTTPAPAGGEPRPAPPAPPQQRPAPTPPTPARGE